MLYADMTDGQREIFMAGVATERNHLINLLQQYDSKITIGDLLAELIGGKIDV